MTNNDILRRIRYILNLNDTQMAAIFNLAEHPVTGKQVSIWLKKEEDPDFEPINDELLALFLNGLINDKRGKKEGAAPVVEKRLTRNIILKKLKIAFNLESDDILEILKLSDFTLSKHELSALFRKPGHKHYRECQEQVFRYFLMGLQLKHRP